MSDHDANAPTPRPSITSHAEMSRTTAEADETVRRCLVEDVPIETATLALALARKTAPSSELYELLRGATYTDLPDNERRCLMLRFVRDAWLALRDPEARDVYHMKASSWSKVFGKFGQCIADGTFDNNACLLLMLVAKCDKGHRMVRLFENSALSSKNRTYLMRQCYAGDVWLRLELRARLGCVAQRIGARIGCERDLPARLVEAAAGAAAPASNASCSFMVLRPAAADAMLGLLFHAALRAAVADAR